MDHNPPAVINLSVLKLRPIENRNEVDALFRQWRDALKADERFKGGGNTFELQGNELPEAVKGKFKWKASLCPAGLPPKLIFSFCLKHESESHTPLDHNNQGAFGRDPADDAIYVLRQWYDTKRIGSRPLTDKALIKYEAPPTAELLQNAGRGRLYLIVAKLTDPATQVAQQTFEAINGFHKVAAAVREGAG